MGAGIALQAKRRYPDLPKILGERIKQYGNICQILPHGIISFPTKHNFYEKSSYKLIEESAKRLQEYPIRGVIAMPPPGCGSGGLWWDDVKPILQDILDDRFLILVNCEGFDCKDKEQI